MKPFKRILVPVDFSPHSTQAVATAADVCRRYEGNITLVHVLRPMSVILLEGYVEYTSQQLADLNASIDTLLLTNQKEAEAAGAVGTITRRLDGIPATEIVNFAQEGGFDLIVMGTHGRTGFAHTVMGSVAERVLRRAPCPVLTVRAAAPAVPIVPSRTKG